MRIIENALYLEFQEAVSVGIPENTIWKAKNRNSPSWQFLGDPADGRKVLIGYEKMQPRYKEMIEKRFGNPYEYVAKEPIRKLVRRDLKANEFYLQYRFEGEKSLPIEHVEKYTAAASWLNMLLAVGEDKKELKKLLNLSIGEFWLKVCEVLASDQIDLPYSYRRLTEKVKQYKTEGYPCLIHKQFGAAHAAKVTGETAPAALLELIAHPNQYDDVWISKAYNSWAKKNDHKTITASTVGKWRRDNEHLIISQREGNSAFNEKYIRQVKGMRPSQPLYLVEHDDNNLDFLFLDPNDSTAHKFFHKYVSICVIDSSCDLLLGKCYIEGDAPKKEMIRAAYIDAMYYIRSITGGWYLPKEIKADRWASKENYPFYNAVAKFVPPSHGNKHRGYIEQFFRSTLWKRSQKIGNDNWSGNNISAKYRGVNMELLNVNKSLRTQVGSAAEEQIELFFQRLRHMPAITRNDMNALNKEQQWLAKWDEMKESDKQCISDEQFLSIFGITHNPHKPITITNRGIEPQINNKKYSYDLPQDLSLSRFVGAKVNVLYDAVDMSRVLVTNNDDIRFIARTAQVQPRALEDQYTGSRSLLNAILREKCEQVKYAGNASEQRRKLLQPTGFNAEAVLQGGVMIKELKNQAEYAYQLPMNNTPFENNADYDPLDDM